MLRSQGGGEKDGLPTLARMRAFFAARGDGPAPPMVMLTGADATEHPAIMEAGAARVVLKPTSQEALRGLSALAAHYRETAEAALLFAKRGSNPGEGWGETAAEKQAAAAPATAPPPSSASS